MRTRYGPILGNTQSTTRIPGAVGATETNSRFTHR